MIFERPHPCQQIAGQTLPGNIVLDATQHRRRSQHRLTALYFVQAEPASSDDAGVELAAFIAADKLGRIDDAQKLLPGLRVYPQVDTDQIAAANIAAGFFQGFAYQGLFRRFPCFDVAAGLAQHASIRGVFFHEQELIFMLDESRNRQISGLHALLARLNTQLTEFDFHFAGKPDLVEHLAIEFGNRRFMRIRNAFPAARL